jgi:prepilin-type N-terminal cleavage/methylation domain-containing protein
MKNLKNLKNKRGFTLIEILVVIALMGVSIGVLGISSSSSASNNLRKCTNSVDAMLARCRINSMYRAEPVFVEFAISGGNIVGRYFESNADGESVMTDEQVMGRSGNITVTTVIDGEEGSLPLRVSFTRRGALILLDDEDEEIPGELTQIGFTNGTLTYVINITPETGSRRVQAG